MNILAQKGHVKKQSETQPFPNWQFDRGYNNKYKMHVHETRANQSHTYTTETKNKRNTGTWWSEGSVVHHIEMTFPQNSRKRLLNAGRSQVVQRVGSGRREPLVVPEEAAVAAAEPPLAEAGEAAPANSRNWNWSACTVPGVGRLLIRRWNEKGDSS